MFDVYSMVIFAIVGYLMSKLSLPRAPIVLALILGPLMESNMRRWIDLANGDYLGTLLRTFVTNPIALIIFTATILTLVMPIFSKNGRISEDMANRMKNESSKA
jgi:putative tricarboxylic transport membrane protein